MMEEEVHPILSSTPQRNVINSNHHQRRCCDFYCNPRQMLLQHRAILLIIVWTVTVGELQALLQILIISFIQVYVPIDERHRFSNAVSSPIAFLHAILAVIAMLYPIGGFIADVCCGRFKTVIVGLSFVVISITSLAATLSGWTGIHHSHKLYSLDPFKEVAPFYIIGFGTVPFFVLGLAAYQANFIQLGLDQLLDAPSIHLSIFVHLILWADILGGTIMNITGAVVGCPTLDVKVKIPFIVVPILSFICFPFLLVISCCKRHWFNTEPSQRNPYKNVINVLKFVRKHDYPLFRSAFTYTGNERPSRMDFAKERYGGPFTTEQVEDVKTFLRILKLLFSVGSVFIMEVMSSPLGFNIFAQHTGYREDFIHRCTIWAILETGALRYFIAVIFLPLYIYRFVYFKRISIFARMLAGLLIYLLGTLSMLAIDLAGHLNFVNDLGTGSHCMFTYARDNNSHALTYPVLEMHWAVLILPNILLGIGPPILLCSIFEFISAQSPHSMKGLLVGVFYTVKGFYQLISSIALIPISSDRIWANGRIREHPPVTNCGFVYFLFTFVVALVGLIVFSVVVKRYKYRERDDRPYDQSVVEEIFDRRNRMRSPTPDYEDIDA